MKGKGAQGHTACRTGKLVKVKLENGDEFVDVFLDRAQRGIHFKEHGWIGKEKIRQFKVVSKSRLKNPR